MAVYRIFPEKTATLYSEYVDMNTGRDEILEISSYYKGDISYVNRPLIAFDSTEVNTVLDNYVATDTGNAESFSASLKLYLANANEVPDSYTVYAYPAYIATHGTWVAGNGKFGDIPRNSSGVSWRYTQSSGSAGWSTTTFVTSSYSGSNTGGGAWYTETLSLTFNMSQSHTVVSTHDLDINITEGVKAHYNEDVVNGGYILKLGDSDEFTAFNNQHQLYLRYFSGQTHTIYPPCLEIKWDDYVAGTGLTETSDPNATIKIKNNRGEYTDEGRQKFELHVRPKYPTRTFSTSSNYLTNHYLPTTSYWGLRDENTEEMVIDFDTTFTKISRGSTGNYFYIYMDGLEPERYYRILIKTTIDGSTSIVDENLVFKVVRNG